MDERERKELIQQVVDSLLYNEEFELKLKELLDLYKPNRDINFNAGEFIIPEPEID